MRADMAPYREERDTMLFGREKKTSYDPVLQKPVIRASICTGEKSAGFIELSTGRFREVMLIRSDADLSRFRKQYGIEGKIDTVY